MDFTKKPSYDNNGLFIEGSICLEDIPDDCIAEAKNGKHYVRFAIAERKTVGKYGETHALYISRKAKNQVAGRPLEYEKVYIGSAQPFKKKEED